VLFVALLVSYPWYVLTTGSVLYIASLPLGWLSYRQYTRKDAEAAAAKAAHPTAHAHADVPPVPPNLGQSEEEDRPSRLN
jgi:CDP-diacylglycerol--serine O-phosphatidyltransferase